MVMSHDTAADLELFGSDQYQQAQLRVYRLWPWLAANSHVANTGRAFGLDGVEPADAKAVANFARDQGAVAIHFLAEAYAVAMQRRLEADGLQAPIWTIFLNSANTHETCVASER